MVQINVFLRITNKREDGYHDLASLFHVKFIVIIVLFNSIIELLRYAGIVNSFTLCIQVISLGDIIKFSLSPSKSKDRLSTNVSGVPLDDRNLVRHLVVLFLLFF